MSKLNKIGDGSTRRKGKEAMCTTRGSARGRVKSRAALLHDAVSYTSAVTWSSLPTFFFPF